VFLVSISFFLFFSFLPEFSPHGEYLPQHNLDELVMDCTVFARAKPEDKLEIVKSFQRRHLLVSMIGDGFNDSPALMESDVGIALGSGTAVAKSAAELILLDNNFVEVVDAVEFGRTIFANIQKFVTFLVVRSFFVMSSFSPLKFFLMFDWGFSSLQGINTALIIIIVLSTIFQLPSALSPMQILYCNLFVVGEFSFFCRSTYCVLIDYFPPLFFFLSFFQDFLRSPCPSKAPRRTS
jgi:magnesium-transporting ATPase (P-type)